MPHVLRRGLDALGRVSCHVSRDDRQYGCRYVALPSITQQAVHHYSRAGRVALEYVGQNVGSRRSDALLLLFENTEQLMVTVYEI
jgi:hypothetical protein